MDEVSREDVLRFHEALRKCGCSDRTVPNKHARLVSWLRFGGLDKDTLPPAPRHEEELPTIYSRDEISSLLGAANEYIHLLIQVALKCGLRDQELMHLEYADINWEESTLRVQGKARWGFVVKDKEQRDVPIAADVLAELMAWKEKHEGKRLILGTESDQPNRKMLRSVKRMAKRAGLNCGRCDGCHSRRRECQEFTLHKSRYIHHYPTPGRIRLAHSAGVRGPRRH